VEVRQINRSSSATRHPKVDTPANFEFEVLATFTLGAALCSHFVPNQPSVLFEGQLHGAGYALGWLPAQGSRASLSRRVCREGHPATGRQAIRSLELTCHVALVSEAGLGSSSGK
jgi:hypothetical protein